MKTKLTILLLIIIALLLANSYLTSNDMDKTDDTKITILTKSDCNILQDEECFDRMFEYGHQVVSQGYIFTDTAYHNRIDLGKFGQSGYITTGKNKEECATVTWVEDQNRHQLYSSPHTLGEPSEERTPQICDVEAEPALSITKHHGTTLLLMSFEQRDPYGGTGIALSGTVCEIDFTVKKLINCQAKSVGIH
jgi:uncharacterized protein YpmB